MIDELLFLCWSRVLGRPWAPDPWLRAKQRKAFSLAMGESKVAEIMARVAVLEELKLELIACVDELDAWAARAHWYALEAERLEDSSPWVTPKSSADADEEPRPPRNWIWSDARGRYVHVYDELEEEEETDGE